MRLNRMCGALTLMFIVPSPAAPAQPLAAPWGLPALMHDLARVHSASATFTERKTMRLLSAPLLVSGALAYVAPDYLRKTTLSPVAENFVLDHGRITMSGGADRQTHLFALNDDPRIGGLVEGIRATLAGDVTTLERFYTLKLTGTAASWQLLLRPKDAGVARIVAWMLIDGSGNRITTIDTASGNGDHSEMGISEAVSDAG